MPNASEPTVFDRALAEYLDNLPKEKAKSKFFDLCRKGGEFTAEQFNDLIQEELSNRNVSGPANRLFNRLAGAIMDYSSVIEQFSKSGCLHVPLRRAKVLFIVTGCSVMFFVFVF